MDRINTCKYEIVNQKAKHFKNSLFCPIKSGRKATENPDTAIAALTDTGFAQVVSIVPMSRSQCGLK